MLKDTKNVNILIENRQVLNARPFFFNLNSWTGIAVEYLILVLPTSVFCFGLI